jgi:hypothetical protein
MLCSSEIFAGQGFARSGKRERTVWVGLEMEPRGESPTTLSLCPKAKLQIPPSGRDDKVESRGPLAGKSLPQGLKADGS